MLVAACGAGERQSLQGSPLAVIVSDPTGRNEEAVAEGCLGVVDGCVSV